MEPITVNELKKLIDIEIKAGNGDKTIFISSDEEGNNFNPLYYGFTGELKSIRENLQCSNTDLYKPYTYENIILLG